MPVEIGQPPRLRFREDRKDSSTLSWTKWSNDRELEEWIQAVGGVFEYSYAQQ